MYAKAYIILLMLGEWLSLRGIDPSPPEKVANPTVAIPQTILYSCLPGMYKSVHKSPFLLLAQKKTIQSPSACFICFFFFFC